MAIDDSRPPIHPAFGRAAHVPEELTLPAAANQIRLWMADCVKDHTRCIKTEATLPRRVIDLSGSGPRLVDFGTTQPPQANYATLSHCWGISENTKPLQTTRATIGDKLGRIPWAALPNLFKDVFHLVKMLDLRYIWIDSICIVQDDPEDWAEQSVKMSQIYTHSYINIAAVSADNSSNSLLPKRWHQGDDIEHHRLPFASQPATSIPPENATIHVRHSHQRGHGYVFGRVTSSDGRIMPSGEQSVPLLSRAWVLQERLLASRSVFFGPSEMIWLCREASWCECNDMDHLTQALPGVEILYSYAEVMRYEGVHLRTDLLGWQKSTLYGVLDATTSADDIHGFWLEKIEVYSGLKLTREFDRPYAVAGIAQILHQRTKDRYLAGLWASDLPRSLAWTGLRTSHDGMTRSSEGIPSWSWMARKMNGTDGSTLPTKADKVRWLVPDPRMTLHLDESFCTTLNNDPFSPPTYGQLVITGQLISGTVELPEAPPTDTKLYVRMENGKQLLLWEDCPSDEKEGMTVHCLLLGTTSHPVESEILLVLKHQADSDVYRRIGLVVTGHGLGILKWRNDEVGLMIEIAETYFEDVEFQKIKLV
jgi:hypothetical protein